MALPNVQAVVFVVVAKIRPHYGEGEEAFVMSLMHATTAA
jgi:hypothetical protein